MKRPLAVLLLGATTAFGQIDNPPTSTSILDATTVGRAVLTASNAAAARSAIEVTLTNLSSTPTLTALTNTGNSVLGTNSTNTVTVGGNLLVGGSIAVTNAATTRTNLGGTSVGNAVFTATSAGAAAAAVGLSITNAVEFSTVFAASIASPSFLSDASLIEADLPISFSSGAEAGTRTNLGLGLPALTNTSNVTTMRALAGSTNTNAPFSGELRFVDPIEDTMYVATISNGIILFILEP